MKKTLPAGWSVVALGGIITEMKNGTTAKQNKNRCGIPVTRIETISNGFIDMGKVGYVDNPKDSILKKFILKRGDILFSHINTGVHLGKTALFDLDAIILHGMNLQLIRPNYKVCDSRFLNYQLNFIRLSAGFLQIAQHAVNQASINQHTLRAIDVCLPPLNEQRRIVEKIETLFARLDAGEAALRKVQTLLARYRQSVLKAAVTGELTQDWRAQNAGCVESGHALLQRILKTRRDHWQGRGKYKEPIAPDTTGLPELPEGWAWASLDALIVDGPTNGLSPKVSTDGTGVPSFKLTATTSGTFVISGETVKYVNAHIEADSKYWLQKDDVLIQRGNTIEYVGTAAIFPGPNNTFIYPDLMMRIRFEDELLARWAVTWINFEYAKKYFRRLATGTAGNMPKINSTTLNTLPVPMPSFEEMRQTLEITESIEHRCRDLEDAARAELTRSKALRQSILKQAFAGRLVSQDPNDEPASQLLARIRTERQSTSDNKRRQPATLKKQA